MATRNKRAPKASLAREGREEAQAPLAPTRPATPRPMAPITPLPTRSAKAATTANTTATTATSAPPRRGAVIALRLATAPSDRDATPRHEPRHEPRPARERPASPPAAPRRPNGARKQFTELRDALASGFEIVQPVFARPLWSAADDSLTAYSFVLRRESATRLVTVPGGRLVEKFIASQRLSVDERH